MERGGIFIKLLGLGGGGSNMASIVNPECGASCCAMDTDFAALQNSAVPEKILIGLDAAKKLSAGGDFELAEKAASQSLDKLKDLLEGVDLLFITVALGGATGSELAIKAAQTARACGAKIMAFCAMPFAFEGEKKRKIAEEKFEGLKKICDFAVALPNDKMIGESKDDAASAFSKANLCVKACVEGVCNMLSKTGLINTDFAALKNLFKGAQNRSCAFSYASADGENSVDEAIKAFKNFPALGYALNASKADKLLVCARCGREVSMPELKSLLIEAAKKFCNHENVLFGAIIEKSSARLAEVFAAGVEFLPEPFQSASEAPAPAQKFSLEHQKMPRAPFRPRARIPEPENSNQSEFGFVDDELKRGYFESTPQNFYYGEDLDIPSFVRKRVKI